MGEFEEESAQGRRRPGGKSESTRKRPATKEEGQKKNDRRTGRQQQTNVEASEQFKKNIWKRIDEKNLTRGVAPGFGIPRAEGD